MNNREKIIVIILLCIAGATCGYLLKRLHITEHRLHASEAKAAPIITVRGTAKTIVIVNNDLSCTMKKYLPSNKITPIAPGLAAEIICEELLASSDRLHKTDSLEIDEKLFSGPTGPRTFETMLYIKDKRGRITARSIGHGPNRIKALVDAQALLTAVPL